ncbi:MAG TPA: hypothetical protein ENH49_04360 [Candidatus Marinimicrobia bacterium]|nr:hypothetical protein [Candidatus Neomarinimicrobiota bacterium]
MAYKVYALHSPKYEKIYIGFSSDLDKRMVSHNEKGTKTYPTKSRINNYVLLLIAPIRPMMPRTKPKLYPLSRLSVSYNLTRG